MDETVKQALIDAVVDVVRGMKADLHLGTKYGGKVFMTDPDVAGSLVGGVFAYKNYVSVEFSQGATFEDPAGLLEGKGRARRHVKLSALSDVVDKDVAGFLTQAFALGTA